LNDTEQDEQQMYPAAVVVALAEALAAAMKGQAALSAALEATMKTNAVLMEQLQKERD
jgi:hypothetical protein